MGLRQDVREAQRVIRRQALERYQERASKRVEFFEREEQYGKGKADSVDRQARFKLREEGIAQLRRLAAAGQLPRAIERRIGPTLDYTPFAPSEASRKAGKPVARIVESFANGLQPEGIATGFLVAPRLLMTNHHVFPTRSSAVNAGANFLHERTDSGLQSGFVVACDPSAFYVADEDLDFAIVALAPENSTQLDELGLVALVEATPKILKGHPVNIIQHPNGGQKHYAVQQNRLVDILKLFLHYETDTNEGSSGAPAFSADWQLVALHHAGIPYVQGDKIMTVNGDVWTEDMPDDLVNWIANEGARVSAIVARLKSMRLADPAESALLQDLLSRTNDPVGEFMGASPLPVAPAPISGGGAMAHNVLNFSGAVTINVAAAAPPAIGAPSPKPDVVVPEKVIQFDPDYDSREGYDPAFLDPVNRAILVPTPKIAPRRMREIYKRGAAPFVLKYHHFELVMNEERRLQMWSAVNVDYDPQVKSARERKEFGSDKWIPDPRIPGELQLLNAEFYLPAGNIDRGHIVRREDNAWGETERAIEYANSDTFHWTNCTPQHEAFNQSNPGQYNTDYRGMSGLWGDFENYVQQSRKDGDTRCCILAGPVLDNQKDPRRDFGLGPVRYPLKFWKVICVAEPNADGDLDLQVYGFMLDQATVVRRFGIEVFRPGRFAGYQVSLAEITRETGVIFDRILHDADAMKGETERMLIDAAEKLRRAGAAAAPAKKAARKTAKKKRAKKKTAKKAKKAG